MKRVDQYILDGQNNVIQVYDIGKWGDWMETHDRHIALDEKGQVKVSTVFLGIDHSITGDEPILFETMVFGLPDEVCERYHTFKEAIEGHKRIYNDIFNPNN
jgi:hypothetical protein